jgi:dTDP-4-dehydrorhamnose reductase
LMKFCPVMSVISHQSLFQPISVKDLNTIIAQLLEKNKFESRFFNLGGHQQYSFYEILKQLKQSKKIKCLLIKLPKCLELPLVSALEFSPYKIITRDNLKSLKVDNICDVNHAYEFLTNLKDLKTYIREL